MTEVGNKIWLSKAGKNICDLFLITPDINPACLICIFTFWICIWHCVHFKKFYN